MTRNCRCAMAATPPSDDVDATLIEHLDTDWAIPCEANLYLPDACQGANTAEYIVRLVACCPKLIGRAPLYCSACLDAMKALPRCACNFCYRVFSPASAAIREVEPLNRRPQ